MIVAASTYVAPQFERVAEPTALAAQTSAIDRFLTDTREASRVLTNAATLGSDAQDLSILRAMVFQRHVAAFERFVKALVADTLCTCGLFDDRLRKEKISLAHILDHGIEGIGHAYLERDVLSSPHDVRRVLALVAPSAGPLDDSTSELLSDVFQVRHSITHHLGGITLSDARKFSSAALRSAGSIRLTATFLQESAAFLEWLVRSINNDAWQAVVAQLWRAGHFTGTYRDDKNRFRKIADIYFSEAGGAKLSRQLPQLYRKSRPAP